MPATPMMPHISPSVSHAPWNGAEIYVAEPRDRLVDASVSQLDADGAIRGPHSPNPLRAHSQLARQRLHRARALGRAGDYGAAVRFAEEEFVRPQSCAVRPQVNVQTESLFLIGDRKSTRLNSSHGY